MRKFSLLLTMGIIMCTQITRAGDDDLYFKFGTGISNQFNNVWKISASELFYYSDTGSLLAHETDIGFAYRGLADWLTLS